jgi:hypothetical protein
VLSECPFWNSVLSATGDAPALPQLRPERRWIHGRTLIRLALGAEHERLQEFRRELAKLYRAISDVSGSRVIVDSSKSPTFAHIVDGTPGVEMFGIHLVRDPRPTSYSWSVDPHFHRTRGPAFGARWTFWNIELEAFAAPRRSRFIRLRLEDFIRNPRTETRRALALIGLEDADLPFVDERSVRLPAHHMIEGHVSRFDTGVIPIRGTTAWQTRLSVRRELSTALLATPLQLAYGYPIARWPLDRAPSRASLSPTGGD